MTSHQLRACAPSAAPPLAATFDAESQCVKPKRFDYSFGREGYFTHLTHQPYGFGRQTRLMKRCPFVLRFIRSLSRYYCGHYAVQPRSTERFQLLALILSPPCARRAVSSPAKAPERAGMSVPAHFPHSYVAAAAAMARRLVAD
jgi:hypothetical protein